MSTQKSTVFSFIIAPYFRQLISLSDTLRHAPTGALLFCVEFFNFYSVIACNLLTVYPNNGIIPVEEILFSKKEKDGQKMKKSKEEKEKLYHKRVGKALVSAVIFTLTVLFSAATFPHSYAAESYYDSNLKLCEEAITTLGEEIQGYREKDSSQDMLLSQQTGSAINIYRQKIIDIQSSAQMSTADLKDLISLEEARGIAAGKAEWVYRSRLYEYKELSKSNDLSTVYTAITEEIASAQSVAFIQASESSYITKINCQAFISLISLQEKQGDSLAVNAIAEGAIDELKKLDDASFTADDCKAIYEKATADISLRRTRDKLTGELRGAYEKIYPNKDFNSDRSVALFVYQLDSKSALPEMNAVLNNTIYSLLAPLKSGSHTSAFITLLSEDISKQIDVASEILSVPSLGSKFEDFEFQYKKATAKDELAAYISESKFKDAEELTALMNKYNREGGIFDSALSIDEITFEAERAVLLADWYLEYMETCAAVQEILSPHSPDKMLELLKNEYKKYNSSMSSISFSEKNARLLVAAEFGKGNEALAKLKNAAKIKKYENDHSEIISISLDNIRGSHTELIKKAIEDALMLDSNIASELEPTVRSLYAKYKSAIIDELSSKEFHQSSIFLWKNAISFFSEEITSIPEALSVADFYSATKRVYQRAEAISDIINKYAEHITSDNYKGFSDISKANLISAAQNSSKIILDVDFTPISWEQRLAEAHASALLVLQKSHCCGLLYSMAESTSSEEAIAIAQKASEQINAALTKEEVLALNAEAAFKLTKIICTENITKATQDLKEKINTMTYLGASQKEDLCAEIDVDIKPYLEALASSTSDELEAAFENAIQYLTAKEENALFENLRNAKREAQAELTNSASSLEAEISQLIYASEEDKQALTQSLTNKAKEFEEKIASANTLEELNSIMAEFRKAMSDTKAEKNSTELDRCKKSAQEEYSAILSKKDRYSTENYNSLLSILEASAAFINTLTTTDEIVSEKKNALSETEKIADLLTEDKIAAIEELDKLYADLSRKKSLYSSVNFQSLTRLYENAAASITSIKSFAERDKVNTTLAQSIADILSVPLDKLETQEGIISSAFSSESYPVGYSISASGYPAYISAESKIPHNGNLKLLSISSIGKSELLKSLIKSGSIRYGSGELPSEEIQKTLKRAELSTGFKLDTSLEFDGTPYRLTVLLPESVAPESIIGVVSFNGNSSGEFYNFILDGQLLTITITAPGEFYLATKQSNFPTAIPIVIGIIILALLCLMISRYLRRVSFSPAPSPAHPTRTTAIQPVSDATSPIAVPKKQKTPDTTPKDVNNPFEAPSSQQEENSVFIDRDTLFGEAEKDKYHPKNSKKNQGAEKAEKKAKKAEINLDLIADAFNDGDIVTPQDLIEKKLIPQDTTFVKILARGKISKPLTVIAQDFSSSAVKAILSAGGSVTVVEET